MIDRFERFSYAIAEISRHWHKLAAEEMEKYGLKGPHCIYLLALTRSEDGLTATQLCDACGKDKSDVSRMMAAMEAKGLVRKEGPNRYRGVYRLTAQGQQAAAHVQTRASRAVALAGADLTPEQREVMYLALESIVSKLRTLSRDGIPEV